MADSSSAHSPSIRKRCCRCGRDLTGHTRYKSREGYWCRECNETDQRRRRKAAARKDNGLGWVITLIILTILLVVGFLFLRWSW